jgi:hypothetical protein
MESDEYTDWYNIANMVSFGNNYKYAYGDSFGDIIKYIYVDEHEYADMEPNRVSFNFVHGDSFWNNNMDIDKHTDMHMDGDKYTDMHIDRYRVSC